MIPQVFGTIARVLQRAHINAAALILGIGMALCPHPALSQHVYATAEEAADALIAAVKNNDHAAMQVILGANWKRFIPTQDRDDVDAFLAAWDSSHHIENPSPEKAVLAVGEQGWTLPIPMAKHADGWRFDVSAGADEMRTRRIGRNELAAVEAARAYFDAQQEYARVDRTGAGVLHYAQQFASSPGKHDGLYWPVDADEEESPLGPLFASHKPGEAYHGYRFKILTAQGKDAPGGAYNYLIKGRMVSGFALIASPFQYGESGIMSFMISHDGQIYEKDLGEDTTAVAQRMNEFNPGEGWHKVDPTTGS